MVPFAPEGYPFVLVPALAGIFAWVFGYPTLTVVFVLVGLACVVFFRDPARNSDAPPEAILAPADGRVLLVRPSPAASRAGSCPRSATRLPISTSTALS